MLKIALVAPIPSPAARMAESAKTGLLRSVRRVKAMSCIVCMVDEWDRRSFCVVCQPAGTAGQAPTARLILGTVFRFGPLTHLFSIKVFGTVFPFSEVPRRCRQTDDEKRSSVLLNTPVNFRTRASLIRKCNWCAAAPYERPSVRTFEMQLRSAFVRPGRGSQVK